MVCLNSPPSAARPACLRGVCPGADPPHALVSLAQRQFMVVPLSPSALDHWAMYVGQRVWVDLARGTLSLQAPAPAPGLRLAP